MRLVKIRSIITTIKVLSWREGTWKLVVALALWVVIMAAVVFWGKDKQIWQKLPKFDEGQVSGETTQGEGTDSAQATVTPSPEATPTPQATPAPSPTPKLTFGDLKRESFPKVVPTEVNEQNLMGPIVGVEIK